MHDALYENLSEWAEVDKPLNIFIKYARELSLNTDQFKKAIETEKFKSKVLKDEQDGGAAQIRYTPTFFINGRIIEGSATYDTLRGGIENELNK